MFQLTTTTDGTVHTIALTGELDHQTTPRLYEAFTGLRLAADDHLVLDLAELTFCDSSGLSAFITAHELTLAAGAAIELRSPPSSLTKMLHIAGLAELFALTTPAMTSGSDETRA